MQFITPECTQNVSAGRIQNTADQDARKHPPAVAEKKGRLKSARCREQLSENVQSGPADHRADAVQMRPGQGAKAFAETQKNKRIQEYRLQQAKVWPNEQGYFALFSGSHTGQPLYNRVFYGAWAWQPVEGRWPLPYKP